MGEGFQFLDIIFVAMVAAFIILRLRGVLGRRTGHESPPPDGAKQGGQGAEAEDNVIQLSDRSEAGVGADQEEGADEPLVAGMAEISRADPKFRLADFVSGSRAAYDMIVTSFAEGDADSLRPMLSDDVFGDFERAIRDRETKDGAVVSTLVGIRSVDIIEAGMRDRFAMITVKFVSEVLDARRDVTGNVVGDDDRSVHEVTDIWTFARDTTHSDDPNWTLVETRSGH